VLVETRQADKREAEALSAEATSLPFKKQRTVPLAPSLIDAEEVVKRQQNSTKLAKLVYARGLFSCYPEAFVFFVPDFELKAGSYKLVEPEVTKRANFPVVMGMCRLGETDADGILRCSTRTCKGLCIHVLMLQLVLELAKAKKCEPPITPEGQFPKDHPPLELHNGLAGFWAVLHRNERWVLCKQAEGEGVEDGAGKWVCQECPSLAKCWHAYQVILGEIFVAPIIPRLYQGGPSVEWQAIPPETSVPPKSDLEIWVCDECCPTNTQKIGPYQFKGCFHEGGMSVHVCQASCEQCPCSKLPAGE
jgi:hypothetical protein